MKTSNEIHEKISEYMNKLDELRNMNDDGDYDYFLSRNDFKRESVCSVIDALLWVIDDESGKEI